MYSFKIQSTGWEPLVCSSSLSLSLSQTRTTSLKWSNKLNVAKIKLLGLLCTANNCTFKWILAPWCSRAETVGMFPFFMAKCRGEFPAASSWSTSSCCRSSSSQSHSTRSTWKQALKFYCWCTLLKLSRTNKFIWPIISIIHRVLYVFWVSNWHVDSKFITEFTCYTLLLS